MIKQPNNEQFENNIVEELDNFNKKRNIYVEAESANIGKCRIPNDFFRQMKESPRIEIIRNQKDRIKELIKTYSIFSKEELTDSVKRIERRLGPQRTKLAIDSINKKNWEGVCNAVLEYYDKCYEYELIKRENVQKIIIKNIYDEDLILEMKEKGLLD